MEINDSILIKFINNDLSSSDKKKMKLLINNNKNIRSRLNGLKNFRSILKKEYEITKKIKMPDNLYKKISLNKKESNKNIAKKRFNNFYKIAASFFGFISLSWIFLAPNTTVLSQNTTNYLNLLIILLLIFIIFLLINRKKE